MEVFDNYITNYNRESVTSTSTDYVAYWIPYRLKKNYVKLHSIMHSLLYPENYPTEALELPVCH